MSKKTIFRIAGVALIALAFVFMWASWWFYPAVRFADGSRIVTESQGMGYLFLCILTIAGLAGAGAWCLAEVQP